MAKFRVPLPEPPVEATEEDIAAQVARGEGILVSDTNTGDNRDIGKETVPLDPSGFEGPPDGNPELLSRLTVALEALAKNQAAAGGNSEIAAAMVQIAKAMERMSEGQMKGSQLVADATKRAQRPSNEVIPAISAFNLRGDKDFQKPRLRCEMFIPYPVEWDSCTREEVELLNLLEQGEYIIKRTDNTKVKIVVRMETKLDSDEPNRLLLNHDTAFNNDNHRLMPPLDIWLRAALSSKPKLKPLAAQVLTMDDEAALILAGKLNDGTIPTDGRVISRGE